MTTFSTLRIAVMTDLHAYSSAPTNPPSWISLTADQGNPTSNPFAGLREMLLKEAASGTPVEADIILCCGDIGDKADPQGQQYAWKEVCGLQSDLGAKMVLGTAGNHDLDSRFQNSSYDARGQIQALIPPFPVADEGRWMEYWAKNFTSIDTDNVRFVLLNTAAYHGYGKEPSKDTKAPKDSRPALPEYEHGRVSDRTIDRIVKDLGTEGPRSANILVCHHHPYKNDQIKIDDYSEMDGGDRLINKLVDADLGPWLVIHGHKHMPRIFYAPGGNVSPTVFSAGSFSARLYPEYADKARNEFYVLELQVPADFGGTTSLRGSMRTWNWSFGNGWIRPGAGDGLGPKAAFGARVDLGPLAAMIASHLKANHAGSFVPWSDVEAFQPEVAYLIPDDLRQLIKMLKTVHFLSMLNDEETGILAQVQVPK